MKSIAESWAVFELVELTATAPASRQTELRYAFYSGVWALLCDLREIGTDRFTEEQASAHLDRLWAECDAFQNRVIRGEA